LDTVNRNVYIGTSIGLGLRFDNFKGRFDGNVQILFVGNNEALEVTAIDPYTNVTIWGGSEGNLFRVNPSQFSLPYDKILGITCDLPSCQVHTYISYYTIE
jgi:hypothetical protein